MKPLYNLEKSTKPLFPSYELKLKQKVDKIFSVPEDNAIGTNSLWNAITLLRLKKDKIKYDVLKKNFLPYVSGGELFFLPIFSDDTIGYAQTRGFLLFNIKNKKFVDHILCQRLEETIDIVEVIDGKKKLFLFDIYYSGKHSILRVADLSSNQKKIISEKAFKGYWSLDKDTIFFYSEKMISATDLAFHSKEHPLIDFLKKNDHQFKGYMDFIFHQRYSFSIVVDYDKKVRRYTTWLIKWNDKGEYHLTKLFEEVLPASLSYSPDNQWLVFKNNAKNPKTYYIMRIDPSFPNYLSAPIPLGEAPNYPEDATAWTTNPLSFVVSKGDRLVRYELEKFKNYNFKDLAK